MVARAFMFTNWDALAAAEDERPDKTLNMPRYLVRISLNGNKLSNRFHTQSSGEEHEGSGSTTSSSSASTPAATSREYLYHLSYLWAVC